MQKSILRVTGRFALAALIVVSMMVMVVPGAAASADTYYVDPVNGSDAADGMTEATAFETITHALGGGGAGANDTVVCLPGTYADSTNGESFPIDIPPGLTLESRDGADTTIIDIEGDDSASAVRMWNPTEGTVLRGFTIRNGSDTDPVVEVNRSVAGSADGWPLIEGNVFDSHEDIRDPVILLDYGVSDGWLQPRIIDNEFADIGEVGEQLPEYGGAIYVGAYVDVDIEGNYFHDINVDSSGGAIYLPFSPNKMNVVDNVFASCRADTYGGAVCVEANDAWTVEVTIDGNEFDTAYAGSDGGAIYVEKVDDLTISGNTITDAYASADGGALYSYECTATMENNWIYDNSCDGGSGAALYVNDSQVSFVNNTVYGNEALSGGWNGIHKEGAGNFNVINSIFWGHSKEDVEDTRIRNSCTEDDNLGDNGNAVGIGPNANIHDDPLFLDADEGDLRLEMGSPCVDSGDDASAPADDIFGTARPADGNANGTARVDMGGWEKPDTSAGRYAGADRYATAADAAKDAFSGGCEVAVIASGQDFPDALSAAGLCGSYDAPLLLTRTVSLPSATSDALKDLGVTKVFIVGGTGAVSSAVEALLKVDYDVTRIAGATRYHTSALVARKVAEHEGSKFSGLAFMARGDIFPDALAVSPFSYKEVAPILLTRPNALPQVISDTIDDLDIDEAYVCGGTGAVSNTVKSEVDTLLAANGGAPSDRWGGVDRYATAVEVASSAVAKNYGDFHYIGIATGVDFPDALAGGVGTGASKGSVLLTRTDSLPKVTSDKLTEQKAGVVYCEVFGGTGAVTSSVETAIEDALGW